MVRGFGRQSQAKCSKLTLMLEPLIPPCVYHDSELLNTSPAAPAPPATDLAVLLNENHHMAAPSTLLAGQD